MHPEPREILPNESWILPHKKLQYRTSENSEYRSLAAARIPSALIRESNTQVRTRLASDKVHFGKSILWIKVELWLTDMFLKLTKKI